MPARLPALALALLAAAAPARAAEEGAAPETPVPPEVQRLLAPFVKPLAPPQEPGAAPPAGAPGPGEACEASRACAERLGRGNVCEKGRCVPYYDRRDLFGLVGLKDSPPTAPRPFAPLVAGVPVIGSSPSTGFSLGVAGTLGILLGDASDTTISSANGSLWYTTKNQVIVQVSATAMTPGNVWELLSDWRFLLFNQDTYGLGTGKPPITTGITLDGLGTLAAVDGAQPMDFDLLRLHQSVLRHVTGSLFLGGGYRLDAYRGIRDERLDLSAATPVVTSHYAYSRIYGFDPERYTASGLSVEVLGDARDSTIAPYRGWFAHLRFTGYPTWLGSTQSATMVSAEGRSYLGLSDETPRNLLALWVYAAAVTSGHVPYLALPSSGWDARGATGRGYVQGRFRGTAMVDVEAEWRFPLTKDGLLGGAVFASAETLSRPAIDLPQYGYAAAGEQLFETLRPAGGFGLRVMLLKQSRTALRIDFAGGLKSFGFYLGSGEAF
jgi:hypothetical protein